MKTMSPLKPAVLLISLVVGITAPVSSFAQAFVSTYDFSLVTASTGLTDPTPPPTAPGVTFGSFSATGLSANPNATVRFSFTTNVLGSVNGSDNFAAFTGSLDPAKYFEVTLTPQATYTLDLDTIAFTIQRSGTGIRSYAVRSSLDGFAANLSASISPANANLGVGPDNEFRYLLDANANAQNGSLVTLGAAFDALLTPVSFRFYGWNAEGVGGTFSIDNVTFTGATTAVPEPSSVALLLAGATGLFLRRKRN